MPLNTTYKILALIIIHGRKIRKIPTRFQEGQASLWLRQLTAANKTIEAKLISLTKMAMDKSSTKVSIKDGDT